MQSKSMSIDVTVTMTNASATIQGQEGSHGGQGEKGIPSPQLDQKPLALVGHKRKASQVIDPFCESDNGELNPNNTDPQQVNLSSVSAPSTGEQQVDGEMVVSQGRDNGKGEGEKGMPRGELVFHLTEEAEGVSNSLKVEKKREEHDAMENTKVDPYVVGENNEVNPSAIEKVEAEPSFVENKEVDPSMVDETGVELHCTENKEAVSFSDVDIEVEPHSVEKNEGKHSSGVDEVEAYVVEKNEVEHVAADKIEVVEPSVVKKKNEAVELVAAYKSEVEIAKKNEVLEPTVADKMEGESYSIKEHEAGPSTSSMNERRTAFLVKMVSDFDLNELPPEEDEN